MLIMKSCPQKKRTLYLLTLGCAKNRVDSEVMLGTMMERDFELVAHPQEAQVIVVNTCAFVHDAKQESIDAILELAELKKKGCCQTLVVAGCLAQRYSEELLKELPEVDHFLGTGAYAQLGDLLADDSAPRAFLPDPEYVHDANTPRLNSMPWYTSYIKVSEGCDNACAFCIIPQIRGPQRSRPIEDIVAEMRQLADSGCVEFNLVAQDLTAYGHDLPNRPKLHTLLREICAIDGPQWIRLHYAYPRDFPDELINVIAEEDKIVKYLDIPIQHINDNLLRRMRRGNDSIFIRNLLSKLRARIPKIVLRTSLIVGLPGESEEEFQELLDFVREQKFERLGCFEYSAEEGTLAAQMEGQISAKTIARRRREIMALQRKISRDQNRTYQGQRIPVLVEGVSPESEHLLVGRHSGQSPEVDGVVYLNDGEAHPGEIVEVEITQTAEYDLVGHVA